MSSEHERIDWLLRHSSTSDHVSVGIGDDAAVVRVDGNAVVSVDAQVEGVHFEVRFADWRTLARRACIAAVSDLCAMGATPRAIFSSLVLPPDFADSDFEAISEGMREAALEVGAVVAGGNLSAGPCVMMDTTVLGEAITPPVKRAGARPGDVIYVRGFPGAAALGLHALLKRQAQDAPAFVEAWRRPRVDVEFAKGLHRFASAAIDVSDGLLQDLSHLCAASGVGAQLDIGAIPTLPGFANGCRKIGVTERDLLLGGGEVYDLLFTSSAVQVDATPIGTIREHSETAAIVDANGVALQVDGFDHFASD